MMKSIFIFLSALLFASNVHCSTTQHYSNAVQAGDFLYISGQFPIDPSGQIVEGDMGTLTNLVIDHIQHLLHVNGFTLRQVVKTEVYLTDVRDFEAMDSAYGTRFHFQNPPARDVIVASTLLNTSRIEISCIAYKHRHD